MAYFEMLSYINWSIFYIYFFSINNFIIIILNINLFLEYIHLLWRFLQYITLYSDFLHIFLHSSANSFFYFILSSFFINVFIFIIIGISMYCSDLSWVVIIDRLFLFSWFSYSELSFEFTFRISKRFFGDSILM